MKDKRFCAPDSGADMVSDAVNAAALTGANAVSGADGNPEYLLQVKNLKKYFPIGKSFLKKNRTFLKAVDGVSFNLSSGKTVGIVGESGCGKTTMGRTILRLYDVTEGQIIFEGRDIANLKGEALRKIRPSFQMIFQDPYSSLSPRLNVGEIIGEAVRVHNIVPKSDYKDYIIDIMRKCGLQPHYFERYPHEFSGGQRQRIGIARALVMEPEFIVADEPISALDVSIRAQVLNLLNSMKKSRGLTYLFIAHDLSVVRFISDRIAVISKGRIVELAEAEELFLHPLHPYTKALLSAVPIPDPGLEKKKKLLVYDPSIHDYSVDKPVWEEIANGHFVYGNQKELEGYRKEYQSQL